MASRNNGPVSSTPFPSPPQLQGSGPFPSLEGEPLRIKDENGGYSLDDDEQAVFEKELLTHSNCNDIYLGDISPRTYQLKIGETRLPDNVDYISTFQQQLICTVAALTDVEARLLRYKLKKWVTSLVELGAGAYGTVYEIFINSYPLFVMKTVTNSSKKNLTVEDIEDDSATLRHGAVVGLFAINKLRATIPTFMHTYGVITCGMMSTIKTGEGHTANMCDPQTKEVPYVILEDIKDAMTLAEFLTKPECTTEAVASILLQVISAIRLAYHRYKFSHYDLNTSNILIQVSKTPVSIQITGEVPNNGDPVQWHTTRYVARIIDLDMSHIVLDKYKLGVIGNYENYGIQSHVAHPGYDIIKIIVLIAFTIDKRNKLYEMVDYQTTWDLLSEMYSVINNAIDLTLHERVALYVVNLIPKTTLDKILIKKYPVDDYGQGLMYQQTSEADKRLYRFQELCQAWVTSDIYPVPPEGSINTANPIQAMDWKNYTSTILDDRRLPDSIIDYWLAKIATLKYTSGAHREEVLQWLNQVDYRELFNKEYSNFSQSILVSQRLLADNGPISSVVANVEELIEFTDIWTEAVRATVPAELSSEITTLHLPALQMYLEHLKEQIAVKPSAPL